MRTIVECVENIKNILNRAEQAEECDGDTLVEINELADEILTINARRKKNSDVNNVWTVWIANDEMETLLVCIATTEKKAYEMRERIEEKCGDGYECQVCKMETDKLKIDDFDFLF